MQNGNIIEFIRREPANTDRLSLILDVARGLEYLHEQQVVHGDLKAINILVTPSGGPVFLISGCPPSKMAMFQILNGKHPPRPMLCSDSLWELLQNCWVGNAEMRPTAPQIVERLEGPSIRATTTSSTTDWDDKFTSKFRRSLQTQPLLPSVTQIERMLFGDACKQCFPDQESSGTGNKKGISELGRQAKRPYEEETSDSNPEDDVNAGRPGAKRSKPSHGIADV
ncbi:kinase-like domain-containing protein [Mycena leptocephala]|nr:kinase-like domain-containing protein [Mycena leptocephala]